MMVACPALVAKKPGKRLLFCAPTHRIDRTGESPISARATAVGVDEVSCVSFKSQHSMHPSPVPAARHSPKSEFAESLPFGTSTAGLLLSEKASERIQRVPSAPSGAWRVFQRRNDAPLPSPSHLHTQTWPDPQVEYATRCPRVPRADTGLLPVDTNPMSTKPPPWTIFTAKIFEEDVET